MKHLFFLAITFSWTQMFSQENELVMYYPFNGNTIDETGNGNNAQNYGAILTNDRFGFENAAYYFDGIDDFMEINPVSDLSEIGDFTISFWIQLDSWTYPQVPTESTSNIEESKYIFNGHAWSSSTSDDFYREGVNIIAARDINDNEFINTGTVYTYSPITYYRTINEIANIQNWKHIVYVREKGLFTTYIDGEVATISFENGNIDLLKTINMMHTLYLGTFSGNNQNVPYAGTYNYKGKLDDFKFYTIALDINDVQNLYTEVKTISVQIVQDYNKDKILQVYPNPTKNIVYIKSDEEIGSIQLISNLGMILDLKKDIHSKITELDLSKYAPGIYLINVQENVIISVIKK